MSRFRTTERPSTEDAATLPDGVASAPERGGPTPGGPDAGARIDWSNPGATGPAAPVNPFMPDGSPDSFQPGIATVPAPVDMATPEPDVMVVGPEVDLDEDPFSDDLDSQLAARGNRSWTSRSTVLLAGLLLLVVGFAAGAMVEKYYGAGITRNGSGGSAAGANAFASRFAGARGANGAAPGLGQAPGATTPTTAPTAAGAGQAGAVTGTVKLVDGTTVYVQTTAGDVLTVRTTASTTVSGTAHNKVADLAPGNAVTVDGPSTGDGTVTASKITKTG